MPDSSQFDPVKFKVIPNALEEARGDDHALRRSAGSSSVIASRALLVNGVCYFVLVKSCAVGLRRVDEPTVIG